MTKKEFVVVKTVNEELIRDGDNGESDLEFDRREGEGGDRGGGKDRV